MIENYRFGEIIIQGKKFTSDIKINSKKEIISPWWRKQGHVADVEDVEDLLEENPEILILGQGDPGLMKASSALKKVLKEKNIELIEAPTKVAIEEYNRLKDKKRVVAGFHLTC